LVELRASGDIDGCRSGAMEPDVGAWFDLLSFVPKYVHLRTLTRRGARLLALDEAHGPVTLDYFAVRVYRLPRGTATPETLLRQVRLELNELINPRFAKFQPVTAHDERRWRSRAPSGALLHMDPTQEVPLLCSQANKSHWRLSTVSTRAGQIHLLSGNREWGFAETDDNGWVFYTRGAERVSEIGDVPWQRLIFEGTRHLWGSFQRGLEHSINSRGGQALVEAPEIYHHPWSEVAAT